MIVRFDSRAVQQNVERKAEPIGVEGDPSSSKRGGISEADAIVREARKSIGEIPKTLHSDLPSDEEKVRVSQEIIQEEEEKEVGPEVDPEGMKNLDSDRVKS